MAARVKVDYQTWENHTHDDFPLTTPEVKFFTTKVKLCMACAGRLFLSTIFSSGDLCTAERANEALSILRDWWDRE